MTADERAKAILIDVATVLAESNSEDIAGAEAVIARGLREAEQATKERCAAKVEEQRRLLTLLFHGDDRHSPLCNDLADAIRKLE